MFLFQRIDQTALRRHLKDGIIDSMICSLGKLNQKKNVYIVSWTAFHLNFIITSATSVFFFINILRSAWFKVILKAILQSVLVLKSRLINFNELRNKITWRLWKNQSHFLDVHLHLHSSLGNPLAFFPLGISIDTMEGHQKPSYSFPVLSPYYSNPLKFWRKVETGFKKNIDFFFNSPLNCLRPRAADVINIF